MADVAAIFADLLPAHRVLAGGDVPADYGHDETLSAAAHLPTAVLLPETVDEVSAILARAQEHRVPVTARGAGSGLSGAAIPDHEGATG